MAETSPPLSPMSPSRAVYDDSLSKTKEICAQVKALQKQQEMADREASGEIAAHLADKQRIQAIENDGVEMKKAADREAKNHLLTKEGLEREDRSHQRTKEALQAAKDDVASMRLQMDAMKVEMEAQRKAFVINVNWAARCTELKTKFDHSCGEYDQLLQKHVTAKTEMDVALRAQEEFRMKHMTSFEAHATVTTELTRLQKELKANTSSAEDLAAKLAQLDEFRAKEAEEETRKKLGSQQALSVLQRSLAKGEDGIKTSAFAGWSTLAKEEKKKRLQKEKATQQALKIIGSEGMGLCGMVFNEWRADVEKGKKAALLAAQKRLEEAASKAGAGSMTGRQRAIAQLEKQFAGEDFSLVKSCFQGWALGQVARKKLEQNHKKASRMIANSSKAIVAEIVGLWNDMTAKRRQKNQEKASNMAKATRMLASSDQALTVSIVTGWMGLIEEIRRKRKKDEAGTAKAMRMMANSQQAFMNLCFDSWAKMHKELKQKDAGNKKALRIFADSNQALSIGVFQAWSGMTSNHKRKDANTAKAVRMIAASDEAITAATFKSWAAYVSKNRDKNKKIRALEKSFGAQDMGCKMVVFTGWQSFVQIEGRRKRAKDFSMKTAMKNITGNCELLKLHIFLAWGRYASFDKMGKVEVVVKELERVLPAALEEARVTLEQELVQARQDVDVKAAELEEKKKLRDEETGKVEGLEGQLDVKSSAVGHLDKEIAVIKVELDHSKAKAQEIRAKLGEVGDFLTTHTPRRQSRPGSGCKTSRPHSARSGRQGSDDKLPRLDASRPGSGKNGSMTAR